MRRLSRPPAHALPQELRAAAAVQGATIHRAVALAASRAAGYFLYAPLLILYWIIFYQNLPDVIGGVTVKPISTTGTIDRFVKICMIGVSFGVLAARWSVVRQLWKTVNPGLVACMVLIPLSALWSIDSASTMLRFTTLISMVLLCSVIPLAGWDPKRIQQMVLPPLMAILIYSLLVGMVFPDIVKEEGTDISLNNSWRGVTFQKNQFGTYSSIVTIICVHRWLAPGRQSVWTFAGLGIGVLCLLLSRSSTSLLATLLAVAFMVLELRIPLVKQKYSRLVAISIFVIILVYASAVQNLIPGVNKLLAPVMQLTGKDMTFSARSVIWDIIKQHSAAAPWLGTGYGAYWTGETPASPSYIFVYLMNFYPTSSHNGYLEILNDLGRVGLICLLIFLVYYLRQALQLMQFDRGQAVLYLALLFHQMVDNLAESEWFSRTATCAVLMLATMCLSRAVLETRMLGQAATARPRSPPSPRSDAGIRRSRFAR